MIWVRALLGMLAGILISMSRNVESDIFGLCLGCVVYIVGVIVGVL